MKIYLKKLIYTGFIILLGFTCLAQQAFPPNGIIFQDNIVPRIDIIIHPDSLSQILEPGNEESNHEFPATFVFSNNSITDSVFNVGFRLRGNTSRYSAKKSFKVSFNSFDNQKYHNLEKLNINGEHNDPSIIRSKLCWDIFRDFGVIASRANHVQLYINNEYKGLYINVEHVDEEFLKLRFGNNDGNLYKCLWPADLDYLGSNPDLYKDAPYGHRTYDLKTNTDADDYSDLAEFIDILNNTPIADLPEQLEEVFDVYTYLRYLVVEIFTGHWDGYSYNMNNFYLYDNPETGLFEFIPYDVDNTIGIDWIGRDWAIRDINDWARHNNPRPLTTRLLEVPEYHAQFNFLFNKLLNEVVKQEIIFPKIGSRRNMIQSFVINDTYHSLDYGWSYQDFQDSYQQALGGHVSYGVFPYFTTRYNSAVSQLDITDISPIISNLQHNHPGQNQSINITVRVEDEDTNPFVQLFYKMNSQAWDSTYMFDDGQHSDVGTNDETFGVLLSPAGESGIFSFYIKASDNTGNTSRYPLTGSKSFTIFETSGISLFINEFMAKNNTTVADANADFDDWIELYNGGSGSIYLGDKFITDNITVPDKWQLPDENLCAGCFLLLWADNDETQGNHHTNFKLSSGGEQLIIFDSDTNSIIDRIDFSIQQIDVSFGRLPNGTGPFQFMHIPTPGYSNVPDGIEETAADKGSMSIYPNPFFDNCKISMPADADGNILIEIFNINGILIFSQESLGDVFEWHSEDSFSNKVSSGLYFIKQTYYRHHKRVMRTGKLVKL